MTTQTMIAPTTLAVSTVAEYIVVGDDLPATLVGGPLSGVEEIQVQTSSDQGLTWFDLYDDGVLVKLTSTISSITFYGQVHVGITKPITINPVGVGINA